MFGPKNTAFQYSSSGDAVTGIATTAVVGKTFVDIAAGGTVANPNVAPAAVGSMPLGVATWDAAPGGDDAVVTVQRADIWSVTAGEAIAAGDLIAVGAASKAVKHVAPAFLVGKAQAAAALGEDVAVALNL